LGSRRREEEVMASPKKIFFFLQKSAKIQEMEAPRKKSQNKSN
jgi:hypothetical protein